MLLIAVGPLALASAHPWTGGLGREFYRELMQAGGLTFLLPLVVVCDLLTAMVVTVPLLIPGAAATAVGSSVLLPVARRRPLPLRAGSALGAVVVGGYLAWAPHLLRMMTGPNASWRPEPWSLGVASCCAVVGGLLVAGSLMGRRRGEPAPSQPSA